MILDGGWTFRWFHCILGGREWAKDTRELLPAEFTSSK
jgi:hypothetical protein